jgi:hypothetical protein
MLTQRTEHRCSPQSAAVGKAWHLSALTDDQQEHVNNDQLVGIMFQRPAANGDDKIVQASEFCERFQRDGTSLGMFAADALETWSIKLRTWETQPTLYPWSWYHYTGRFVNGDWKTDAELQETSWPEGHRYRTSSYSADGERVWVYAVTGTPDDTVARQTDNPSTYIGNGYGMFFEPVFNGNSHQTSKNSTTWGSITFNTELMQFRSTWGYTEPYVYDARWVAMTAGPMTCRYDQSEGAASRMCFAM